MTGWIVAAVIAALAIWPVLRVRGLHHEIEAVREQMARHRHNGSSEPLAVIVRDDALERLAAETDASIDAHRRQAAEGRTREARLRREIADLSHDLKTPLIAVRGFLQLVERDGLAAASSPERLSVVRARVDDLGRLVEDFFELSVLDSSERRLELAPVNATEVVTEVLVGFYTSFEAKGIEPEVRVPGEALLVMADATALARVVRNLVANALAYTGGGVRLELAGDRDHAKLVVANPSPGMTDEQAQHLFERFYRADRARTGPHAGLGLAIVLELVRQMAGSVSGALVSGELVITVHLPVADQAVAPASEREGRSTGEE